MNKSVLISEASKIYSHIILKGGIETKKARNIATFLKLKTTFSLGILARNT